MRDRRGHPCKGGVTMGMIIAFVILGVIICEFVDDGED